MTAPLRTGLEPPARRAFWRRRGRVLFVLAALAAMVAAAWAGARVGERWALADLRRTAQAALGLQVAALRAEMQQQSALPLTLANDPEIVALADPDSAPELAERVSARLAQVAAATGAAVIYVMQADGRTVAASNAGSERTFVDRNYAFRPYFQQARREGSGSQFALGTVSGRPGFYLARRIAGTEGVVVVKIEFDGVEAAWRKARETAFVTDPRGIVLMSSDPSRRFQALRSIAPDERQRIAKTLEFGGASLSELPLHADPAGADLVRVGNGALPAWPAIRLDAAVPGTDWRLHTLTPVRTAVRRERLLGGTIALLGTGLGALVLSMMLERRARARARLAEATARRAELEARVRERTEALSEANRRLRAEAEERQRAEAERERLGRELAQASRLTALGQFAASMAHEINQPLAALRSYADNTAILVRRGRVDDAAENMAAIGRLTDRIGALTRQLKGFARRASGRREPVALCEILANAVEMVAARAMGAGIDLAVCEPAAGLTVLGDGPRLEQVVVNLLQNALDAVAGRPAPRVALSVAAEAGSVRIEVGDNGPGIPETTRAQVFDPFFTTKSDGLGLGLAIARGIVEDCGGSLAVAEAAGGGAVFRMTLPRAPEPAAGQGTEVAA